MNSFEWNSQFLTEIDTVDRQHKELVLMVNELGTALTENTVEESLLKDMLVNLTQYTRTHFRTEEALMEKLAVDPRHTDDHIFQHDDFIAEVEHFGKNVDIDNKLETKQLFEYLVHWLVYHILGADQNMARQIKLIEQGKQPAEAYEQEEQAVSKTTEPLLMALHGLFDQVSQRNKQLRDLNKNLEERVAERTRELVEANQALEIISITDHLTELPNRRFAMRQLTLLFEESEKLKVPLSCLMIDIDGFKYINDTHGHDAGDQVLQKLARELKHSVRNDDIMCRLGGDEFFAICPHTDHEGALKIGEQIRRTISTMKLPTGDGFWDGSVSIGVATTNSEITNIDKLMKRADEAVYIAKEEGKNCVRSTQVNKNFKHPFF